MVPVTQVSDGGSGIHLGLRGRYLGRPELWSATPDQIKTVGFYELVRN